MPSSVLVLETHKSSRLGHCLQGASKLEEETHKLTCSGGLRSCKKGPEAEALTRSGGKSPRRPRWAFSRTPKGGGGGAGCLGKVDMCARSSVQRSELRQESPKNVYEWHMNREDHPERE